MGKYLHRYESANEFMKDYYGEDSGPITAITIDSGEIFTGCDDEETTPTTQYNGRYVFDREMDGVAVHSECGGGWDDIADLRVFKNGDVEIYDLKWDGNDEWGSVAHAEADIIHNLSDAFEAGDVMLHVSSIERGQGAYHEPWVSYTTDKCVSKFEGKWTYGDKTHFTMEYVGECEWYEGSV